MLVLSRKLDQVIHIGNDVEITVLAVKGNTVRLGIKAPRDVKVLRAELPVIPTQATVIAIVDSPEAADQQIFVGKLSAGQNGCGSDLKPATSEPQNVQCAGTEDSQFAETQNAQCAESSNAQCSAVRLARGSSPVRTGTLRDYLRDHHNSTAV